ncbi:transmembrane protein 179B-like [Littorina saxatilis]|uniref:MARVEL domain-containing protein n=1 Tax=Littorina saxatilis TaxID=31220 RepID=A0AAN9BDC6_9CAEN
MDFVTEENLIRLKVGMYGALLFFSFFTIIAVPVTTNNIGGCFLYRDATTGFGSASNCNYAVAMAVMFGLMYALFRLLVCIMLMLGKLNTEFVLLTDLFQLIYTAVDTVACFLVFISACILSSGINSGCDVVNDCSTLTIRDDDSVASRMHTAEAGAWISFILWLLLAAIGIFWLFRQGKIPFLSRPAAGDGGTQGGATAPASNMDTPPAVDAESTKY